MSFLIHRATLADYDQLCVLFEEGDIYHRDALPRMFCMAPGPARPYDLVADLLEDDEQALFVAESGQGLVGLVAVRLRHAPDIPIIVPHRYAHVGDIVVKEGFCRSGIGSALMEAVRTWAQSEGVAEIQLNVFEFNKGALAFYERLGYRTMSRNMWLAVPQGEQTPGISASSASVK